MAIEICRIEYVDMQILLNAPSHSNVYVTRQCPVTLLCTRRAQVKPSYIHYILHILLDTV
jgi:hypothetical protein